MPSPTPQCRCGSGLTPDACHDSLLSETYEPISATPSRFAPPPHLDAAARAQLARRLSDGYQLNVVVDESSRLSITSSAPMKHLLHWPVARRRSDQFDYWEPPLGAGTVWPTLTLLSPERQQECRRTLQTPRQVSIEWLRAIQGALYGVVIHNTPEDTERAIQEALQLILQHFPNATIDCLVKLTPCVLGPRASVSLASMSMLPIDELMGRLNADHRAGPNYVILDPDPHFTILDNLAFPLLTGFSISHSAYSLQIDFGEPLNLPSTGRDERKVRDVTASLLADPFDAPTTVVRMTNPTTRHLLRAWLTRRLNFLFAHLSHPATFTDDSGQYYPERQWHATLAVQDIVAITNLLLTELEPATMRLLFFDLIDRYCVLQDPSGRPSMVLNAAFIRALADSMHPDLGPLRDTIANDLAHAWERVRDELWNDILDPAQRANRELVIRKPDGSEDGRLSPDEFATAILETLRNTTHGYGLRREQFDKYLVRHTCQLPHSVRWIALGFWFGLLSNPGAFWRARANFNALRSTTH